MSVVKLVKAADMFPLVQEIFENGGSARITVTGMSMYPFLRDGKDSVELAKTDFSKIRRGDIVLALRNNGQYFLHRIYKKNEDSFFMMGDAQTWIDGPYMPNQLIAIVTKIWRQDKIIECSSFGWRVISNIWRLLKPVRRIMLRIIGGIERRIVPKSREII